MIVAAMTPTVDPARVGLALMLCAPPTDRALTGWQPMVYPLTTRNSDRRLVERLAGFVTHHPEDAT